MTNEELIALALQDQNIPQDTEQASGLEGIAMNVLP